MYLGILSRNDHVTLQWKHGSPWHAALKGLFHRTSHSPAWLCWGTGRFSQIGQRSCQDQVVLSHQQQEGGKRPVTGDTALRSAAALGPAPHFTGLSSLSCTPHPTSSLLLSL
ncbi:unnamed protein product [Rangifer tarandus platyrhynchus]|uniref:Uncharacterized protein n=1 Tax=Rangifer tarandus platyrhynchus TaxID=3082113 RepID=A0AC60A122_RANTA